MNNQEPQKWKYTYGFEKKRQKIKEQLTNLRDFDSRLTDSTEREKRKCWFSEKLSAN